MVVSYSGLSMYTNCPSSFKRKYVVKEVERNPPTEVTAPKMFRGTRLHKAAEDFINGDIDRLPKEIAFYTQFFTMLKDSGAQAERKWSFTNSWEECEFDDKDAGFMRGVLDLSVCHGGVGYIYELKTGKEYPEHANQRSMYGLAGLLLYPEVDEVDVITVYMDLHKNVPTSYTRSMLSAYKWVWERKVNKTRPPQPYPMRPSWKCRFCAYSKKSNGGLCPH